MHSIDVAEKFYRDKTRSSGFMATFAKEKIFGELHGTHTFHLGKYLPQVIDGIGGNIDFVILDTVHSMPGEGLDFLAVIPYLKIGSVIVLHDVILNQINVKNINNHATTALFSAVTADKFLNFTMDFNSTKFNYPNIAAFKINEQTAANIENVFLTMILRWAYLPSQGELNLYRLHYQKHYPKELCALYIEAVKMNLYNLVIAPYN